MLGKNEHPIEITDVTFPPLENTPPQAETAAEPQNKYGFFQTGISNSLSQATIFSIGAAVRNQPVRKGAITALAGGAVVGAVLGFIGDQLGIKNKGNSFNLTVCSYFLEWALTLATMPLGAQIVPFEQNLSMSTLIEDQLVGSTIMISPALAMLILIPCCLCACYAQLDEEEKIHFKQSISETLRAYSSTLDLVLTVAEYPVVESSIINSEEPQANTANNNNILPTAYSV